MTVEGGPRLRIAQMVESDGPGGAEMMILQLSLELQRRGHLVVLVGPPNGTGWLAAQLKSYDLDLHTFSLRRPLDYGCYRGLRDLMRTLDIGVVHSHDFTMALYGAAAARSLRKRHVITFHGGLDMLERWRRRFAARWAVRVSAASVVVSDATRQVFSRRLGIPPGRLGVVPNGIKAHDGDPSCVRMELGLRPGEVLVLAVGNVMSVKGHLTLVQALARFLGEDLTWRLVIAGEERDAAGPIRAFVTERRLEGRVQLLGHRDDVANLLAAADIFVMPSLSEGLPIALLEAMFASRAIIASAVGGIPEVITDGHDGLLVPPNDPEALARSLRRLLDDRKLRTRLGEAARARAVKHHSVGAMADAYERLYYGTESLTCGPGAPEEIRVSQVGPSAPGR